MRRSLISHLMNDWAKCLISQRICSRDEFTWSEPSWVSRTMAVQKANEGWVKGHYQRIGGTAGKVHNRPVDGEVGGIGVACKLQGRQTIANVANNPFPCYTCDLKMPVGLELPATGHYFNQESRFCWPGLLRYCL